MGVFEAQLGVAPGYTIAVPAGPWNSSPTIKVAPYTAEAWAIYGIVGQCHYVPNVDTTHEGVFELYINTGSDLIAQLPFSFRSDTAVGYYSNLAVYLPEPFFLPRASSLWIRIVDSNASGGATYSGVKVLFEPLASTVAIPFTLVKSSTTGDTVPSTLKGYTWNGTSWLTPVTGDYTWVYNTPTRGRVTSTSKAMGLVASAGVANTTYSAILTLPDMPLDFARMAEFNVSYSTDVQGSFVNDEQIITVDILDSTLAVVLAQLQYSFSGFEITTNPGVRPRFWQRMATVLFDNVPSGLTGGKSVWDDAVARVNWTVGSTGSAEGALLLLSGLRFWGTYYPNRKSRSVNLNTATHRASSR